MRRATPTAIRSPWCFGTTSPGVGGHGVFRASSAWRLGWAPWLPNMMASQGMTITKSLTYTLGMQMAFPAASLFMMFALEKFGRNHRDYRLRDGRCVRHRFRQCRHRYDHSGVGFCMIFFIQLPETRCRSSAPSVPTNARASGFGIAQSAGRLATAGIIPGILWVQTGYGNGWYCLRRHRSGVAAVAVNVTVRKPVAVAGRDRAAGRITPARPSPDFVGRGLTRLPGGRPVSVTAARMRS